MVAVTSGDDDFETVGGVDENLEGSGDDDSTAT
jgi:hypothetical protein